MTRNFSIKKISGVCACIDRIDTAVKYGNTDYVSMLERNLHMQAIVFYHKCHNRHINGRKLLRPYQKRIKVAYCFNGEEYKVLLDRKERILHWTFARNYFFDILDAVIKDTTRF